MNKKKVLYMIDWDGIYSSIRKIETTEEADGFSLFKSFTKAKTYLLNDLRGTKQDYAYSISRVSSMKEKDLQDYKLSWE